MSLAQTVPLGRRSGLQPACRIRCLFTIECPDRRRRYTATAQLPVAEPTAAPSRLRREPAAVPSITEPAAAHSTSRR